MFRQAAAQYTEISVDDMVKFLSRGFRALHPTPHALRGEMVIDLALNSQKTVGIRVWTSIPDGGTHGAAVGADAIRVQFFNFSRGWAMPILKEDPEGQRPKMEKQGKAPIVKRTQNWRDNLKDRIEDWIEVYDQFDSEYDRLAR